MAQKECFPCPMLSITLLLFMAELVFSVSEKVTCNAPSVKQGEVMALTCDFGIDVTNETKPGGLSIRRTPKSTGSEETILACFWNKVKKEYECTEFKPRFCFKNEISRYLSIYLPKVTKDDEGDYACVADGKQKTECSFSLEEPTPKPVTTPMLQTTTHPPPRPTVWKTIAIVFIVVSVILLLVIIMQNVTLVIFFDTVVEKLAFLSKKERSSNNSAIPAERQPFLDTGNPVKETEHTSPTPGMGPAGEKPPQKDVEAGAGTVVAQGAQNKRMSQDNKDGKASQDTKDPAPKATETGEGEGLSVRTESEIKGGGDEK